LLEKSSGHLELREDPEQGIIVAGLRCIKVQCYSLPQSILLGVLIGITGFGIFHLSDALQTLNASLKCG
jgi:hypothetical protein